MSRLLIVRHGQASADSEDYDQLSELGYRQARHLGEQWAAEGLAPDSVYVGPCKRHRQTAEAVAAELADDWPAPVYLDGWDEHDAYQVVMYSIPRLAERDPWVAERAERARSGGHDARRAYFDLYRHITRLWVLDELHLDGAGFEPWPTFRARVHGALDTVIEREGRGRTIAVITSSGPVAVTAGRALGLDDEGTMALSWLVQNIAVTEVVYDDATLALKSFNSLPRLVGEELHTLV